MEMLHNKENGTSQLGRGATLLFISSLVASPWPPVGFPLARTLLIFLHLTNLSFMVVIIQSLFIYSFIQCSFSSYYVQHKIKMFAKSLENRHLKKLATDHKNDILYNFELVAVKFLRLQICTRS